MIVMLALRALMPFLNFVHKISGSLIQLSLNRITVLYPLSKSGLCFKSKNLSFKHFFVGTRLINYMCVLFENSMQNDEAIYTICSKNSGNRDFREIFWRMMRNLLGVKNREKNFPQNLVLGSINGGTHKIPRNFRGNLYDRNCCKIFKMVNSELEKSFLASVGSTTNIFSMKAT